MMGKGTKCKTYIKDGFIYKQYETPELAQTTFNAQMDGFLLNIAPEPIEVAGDTLKSELTDISIQDILQKDMYYNKVLPDLHNKVLIIFDKYGIRQDKKKQRRTDLVWHNLGLIDNKIVLIDWS